MSQHLLEANNKKIIRWRILKTLDAGRPVPLKDDLLLDVIKDCDLEITRKGLLRALNYLEEKGYVKTNKKNIHGVGEITESSLTAKGIDFVDYTIQQDDPGIKRPEPI